MHTAHASTSCAQVMRLAVGERIGVSVPGDSNVPHNNKAPIFYTSMEKISVRGGSQASRDFKNKAIDERFTTRFWYNALPLIVRMPNFPHCGKCFAAFVLDNDVAFHASTSSGSTGVRGTWV